MRATFFIFFIMLMITYCARYTVEENVDESGLDSFDDLLTEEEFVEQWMLTRETNDIEQEEDENLVTGFDPNIEEDIILSDKFVWEETYDEQDRLIALRGYDAEGELAAIMDREYNNGNITNYYYYQIVDGIVYEESSTYIYNEDNRLIRKTYDQIDAGEEYEGFYEYEYNSDGKLIEKYYQNKVRKTTFEGTYRYQYDEEGNLIEYSNYDSAEELNWKYEYLYRDGYRSGYYRYDGEGNILSSFIISIDDDGNKTHQFYHDNDLGGMDKGYYYYVYDDQDRILEVTKSDPDKTQDYRYSYVYNEDGSIQTYSEYDSSDELIIKLVYKYDDWGNKTGVTHYNPEGEINSIYKFLYDDMGNLTNYESTNLTYWRVE